MRKVQMRTTAAGPAGTFMAGRVYLVEDELAATWIAGGYAVDTEADPTPLPAAEGGVKVDAQVMDPVEGLANALNQALQVTESVAGVGGDTEAGAAGTALEAEDNANDDIFDPTAR